MPGLHPGFVAPDVLASLDVDGDAMTRGEAMAMIRPVDRPFFVETCDFLGCVDNDEDGPYDDVVIRLLADGYGGRGIYVSCGECPEEGSQHFGLDPAARAQRGNARRRELMAQIEARTTCTFIPCALCHEGDARETVYWLVHDGRPVCEPCGDAGDLA